MLAKVIKKAIKVASDSNQAALKNSHKLVETAIHFGHEYNKRVVKKALAGGVQLAKRQYKLNKEVFEIAKNQISQAKNRFEHLSKDIENQLPAEVKEVVKSTQKTVEKSIEKVDSIAKEVTTKANELKDSVQEAFDDLTQINGVGPKFAEVLNDFGITKFEQLATEDLSPLQQRLEELGGRYKSIDLKELAEKAKAFIK